MKPLNPRLFAALLRPSNPTTRDASSLVTPPVGHDFFERLDHWVEAAPATEIGERIEAHRRIIRCEERNEIRLDLSHLAITDLPGAISQMARLEHLDVVNGRLQTISPEIGQLRRLKCLHLAGNDLTALPAELANLKKLRRLFLNNNQFLELPPWLAHLPRLELLHAPNNRLSVIPELIKDLPSLTDLDVRHNEIRELPSWLADLKLRHLDIAANPIEDLGPFLDRKSALPAVVR